MMGGYTQPAAPRRSKFTCPLNRFRGTDTARHDRLLKAGQAHMARTRGSTVLNTSSVPRSPAWGSFRQNCGWHGNDSRKQR